LLFAGEGEGYDELRYDPAQLTAKDPLLAEFFQLANEVGFRIGVWGGPPRDMMLTGNPPPADSDVDLVYDSEELRRALETDGFRKRAKIVKTFVKLGARHGPRQLRRYSFMNLQPVQGYPQSVHRLMRTGGLTLNQVALMSDGTIIQFNNGFRDLRDGLVRYATPRPVGQMISEFRDILDPSPYDVLRAIRFKTQYPGLEWAPGTLETFREIMAAYAPESERTQEIATVYKGLRGKLRKWMPRQLNRVIASVSNRSKKHRHSHLRPYIEKGFDKLLGHAKDPVEALKWVEELGLDDFANAIGMGEKIEALRALARGEAAPRAPEQSTEGVRVPRLGAPYIPL
jgi:hypothetical protein